MSIKTILGLLMLASGMCLATDNQLDFNIGRGFPQSSIQDGSSFQSDGSRGTSWSLDILHQVAKQFSLGIGGGHFSSGDNSSNAFIPDANSTVSSKMTSLLVLGRMNLSTSTKFIPYAIAGFGWARNSLTLSALPGGTYVDDSKNALGYALGAGADVAVTSQMFVGVEARYQGSTRQSFDMTSQGESATGETSVGTALKMMLLGVKASVRY